MGLMQLHEILFRSRKGKNLSSNSNLGDCYKAVLKCFREKKSGKTTFGPGSVDLDSNIKCNFAKET